MRCLGENLSLTIVAATAALVAGCALPTSLTAIASDGGDPLAAAHRLAVLHFFTGPQDGSWPNIGRLAFDRAGNLYGATILGGSGNCKFRKMRAGFGTIFELEPSPARRLDRASHLQLQERGRRRSAVQHAHARFGGGYLWCDDQRRQSGMLNFFLLPRLRNRLRISAASGKVEEAPAPRL